MPGHSFLASPSATIDVLKAWGLHTKKSMGQHFLVDDNVVGNIIDLAGLTPGETVLEVGPGIGTLTVAMMEAGCNVVAVECDSDLIPVLEDNARLVGDADGHSPGKLQVIEMDAMDLDSTALSGAVRELGGAPMPRKFVANLPYAVAATLVLKYLQTLETIDEVCVMVQAEVADRMSASPGSGDYGAYSVKLQLLANPGDTFPVKRSSFLPPPRVDSKVIKLNRVEGPAGIETVDSKVMNAACLMADAAFFQRRKTVRNSMRAYMSAKEMDPEMVDGILEASGIDPKSRGEQHPVGDFISIGKAFLEYMDD
ncbi:MAG: 16S rRNA (adenine(1518)-N(6)/adenine(1519)-N(6))-dimethyltransferase RsmA [Coriobacteriales bacterium]|jgi:16S rRNA (adenine1518-N6/adenine1519-N6)-dimethyltransferase